MRKIDVFVGGSVGSDPFAASTWSGSSANLLRAIDRAGLLASAAGVRLSRAQNAWFQVKNFSSRRAVWRQQFYLDPAYREALTSAAAKLPGSHELCLQYGAMFCLPRAFPQERCLSYQDGNLAQTVQSGFSMRGVSRQRIDRALRYEEDVAQQMTAVLTFSEYLRQSFIHDYHVPAERVFNIGGGVNMDIPDIVPQKDYTRNRLLFIGTEFARKGGPLLLEAFRLVRETMPAAQLDIVGPEKPASAPAGVTFYGRLFKTDATQKATLERLFREATLFVLPSLYEPFGIAPLEAMLYQLPCVLTDDWAFHEFVTPGQTGELAQKGSAEDFAAKICLLLADPARLAPMGMQARASVLERYTWNKVVTRMAAVLESL